MSDIFREVDEEMRREQAKRIWDRYGHVIIALCVAVILGVGGWKGWQAWQQSRAETAGARFTAAMAFIGDNKAEQGRKLLAEIAKDGPAGYSALARMHLAAEDAKAGRVDQAIKAYDELSENGSLDALTRGLARIRAGYLLLEQGKRAELEKRVKPLDAAGNNWRHSARELLALAAQKAGEEAAARALLGQIVADPAAPNGIRRRAQLMLGLLVPQVKTPAKPAAPAATPPSTPAATPDATPPAATPDAPRETPAPPATPPAN